MIIDIIVVNDIVWVFIGLFMYKCCMWLVLGCWGVLIIFWIYVLFVYF